MYIHREAEKIITPFLLNKEAISIVGPRQAGKTTLVKYLADELEKQNKRVKFLTFEKEVDLRLFNEDIENFKVMAVGYDCVIIDEFQLAVQGGKNLKYLYDTTNVKFIISGSSSLELTFQTGKYMVGRLLEFELLPFSFREYLSLVNPDYYNFVKDINFWDLYDGDVKIFKNNINDILNRHLFDYVLYGGYPAVCFENLKEKKIKVLESISEAYLYKDIKGLLNLATDNELKILIRALAGQIGSMIQYQELSNISGLNFLSLKKHLNLLEKTYVLNLIKPFFINKRVEITKNPKVYFYDLGLRNYVLRNFESVISRNDIGSIMENQAFLMLKRNNYERAGSVNYWRTQSKAEVDFVVEKQGQQLPIEVKFMSKRKIGKSLYSFIAKFKPPTAAVLTKDYIGQEKIDKTVVKFVPLCYF